MLPSRGILRFFRRIHVSAATSSSTTPSRFPNSRRKKNAVRNKNIEDLVEPKKVKHLAAQAIGMEDWIVGLDKTTIEMALDEFMRRPMVRQLAQENGINDKLFMRAFRSFKEYCTPEDLSSVDSGLLILFSDISKGEKDVEILYSFFLDHAKQVFPHLEAMDDLRIISDLTKPHNWYPEARSLTRKIYFHAGPTNSGKTYHALKRFNEAKSAVFCGPLKLLATEVFHKSNELGVACDLVTGEERRFAKDNHHPAQHLSSTVEMLSTQMRVEVAVIDEIQMLRDEQRGWAWTRALLGAAADEVHLCGEPAAIDIVKKLLEPIGETVEVRYYDRKTPLTIADKAIESYDNIEPGDCIVCFSKKHIFYNSKKLEEHGIKPAVIYGDLPPGTKLAQAAKFNDPNDPCNVLVATDAIGMGLNLNIRRVIFNSCTRQNELLPTYSALQIAGRAGRFGTAYANGVTTTLRSQELATLKTILAQKIEPITNVGIAPTYDQIETFSFHLPQASFVRLLDLFVSVCSVSNHFFICTVDDMRELAVLIDQIPLPLKVRYTFCTSPLNTDDKMPAAAFVKMARRFSTGQALTYEWMMDMIEWPPAPATNLRELVFLEQTYEILDQYMWLSMRFPDMLPDEPAIREASRQLDQMIQEGVDSFMSLIGPGENLKRAEKSSRPSEPPRTEKKSILEKLLKRADLSDLDLEQLREELNKAKK
ncbi:unnamed protein product [Caenorhabditis angaria]|uniref:ATP-dependent RNA helicase SUV3 homolog, mitochondrial n=1 Tax=Caenorhabditis angaria TaxID=860376 RepID=A0A9P1IRI2_9PELO|nr:unnamed protein product [Caenorhabditis angaria]